MTPVLANGCARDTSISVRDTENVLTLTAEAANKKLLAGYCIRPDLEDNAEKWAGQIGKDGWITAPNDQKFRYRLLPAPEIASLPRTALAAFNKAQAGVNCHHPIVFEKPQFVEFKFQDKRYVEAYVNFSDRCPLCGYGAVARFRKTEGQWKMAPEGIEGTWIS
ncbi:hypothetical protein [Novosphingobium umbonatum]|nr:hypothetical protein [Novosphingobium umbonatum]